MEPPTSPPQPILPLLRYSSSGQRPQDRYAEWREGSLLAFGRRYNTVPTEPFAVDTSLTNLGPIGFAQSRMTGQRWHRTRDHFRADDDDALMVSVRFSGEGWGDANGRDMRGPAGSIILSDFAQPFAHDSTAAFSAVIRIPRELAERTLPAVSSLHGLVIAPSHATLLRSHALATIDALDAGLPAAYAERLARVTLDLLEIGIAQTQTRSIVTSSAVLTGARLKAEAAIDRNLASDSLTIANLCRWAGVSRATLYRLFEAEGGVQAYVRSRRLARIEDELRASTSSSLEILAERWGFSNASRLTRQFRARYGVSPSDFRASFDRPSEGAITRSVDAGE